MNWLIAVNDFAEESPGCTECHTS